MTDNNEAWWEAARIATEQSDLMGRAQEVAAGVRTKAISEGVQEQLADAMYAQVFSVTAMRLTSSDCDCEACSEHVPKRRYPWWLIFQAVIVGACLGFVVVGVLVKDPVLAFGWALCGSIWAGFLVRDWKRR